MIFIIEDDTAVLDLTKTILERNGYKTEAARSAKRALESFQGFHQDVALVIADVVLPDMRGPELVRRLLEIRPDLKVLFMSGYTDEILTDAFQNESFEVLRKPFTVEAMLAKVRAALGMAA